MYKLLFFAFTLLWSQAPARVIHQQIITDIDSCEVTPAWSKTNQLNIVPLVSEARTGLVPPEVEEGLIYALGPRFANVFIKSAKSDVHAEEFACLLKCAGNVIRLAPCIATSIASGNPIALLSCGLNKGKVCDCARCLPDPVKNFVNNFCSSNSLPTSAMAEDVLPYPDWIQFSQRAPYLQGFRGDLKKTAVDEARGIVGNHTSVGTQDIFGFCPGVSCGSCGCCLGLCALGSCVGACI